MKNLTKRIFILILFVSIVILSIVTVSASEVSTSQTITTSNDGVQIEAKYKKVSKNKIVFNGNGGKIGSKKTVVKNVNKGAKISKFPASPKRAGYNFKGWYTKKSGGTKISVNTKPTKSVTYYAQWEKKRSSTTNTNQLLNEAEKKLVGKWVIVLTNDERWWFNKEGTFTNTLQNGGSKYEGVYSVTNGVLTVQRQGSSSTIDYGIKFGTDSTWGEFIQLDYKNWGYWLKYYKSQ